MKRVKNQGGNFPLFDVMKHESVHKIYLYESAKRIDFKNNLSILIITNETKFNGIRKNKHK